MFRRLRLLLLLLTLAVLAGTAARAGPPLSVDDALKPGEIRQAAISPDGKHVLAITDDGKRLQVMLVNTDDFSHRILLKGGWLKEGDDFLNKVPASLMWVNSGLFAVNYFGGMAESHDLRGRTVSELGSWVLGKATPGEPESTGVVAFEDARHRRFSVVDAATGKSRSERYPAEGELMGWVFDGAGRLRVVTLGNSEFWNDRSTLTHWYRSAGAERWTRLDSFSVTQEGWSPIEVSATTDELTVMSRQGRDTMAVFLYDPVLRQLGRLLLGDPAVDIERVDNDPLTANYRAFVKGGMKPQRQWLDARWSAVQKAVDEVLPGHVNTLSGSDPKGRVLVFSYADVEPGRWYLLDVQTMKMRLLFVNQPDIDPARMRPMGILSYPAGDGLRIPAYLTRPADQGGPWPLVVVVHGGPTVRDSWGWHVDVQLLATRGYAVLQPQFRGSSGFGKAFEEAGIGQWGRAMQDDITAGVEQMIRDGIADPKRICIYGASYGGYAALWGLIMTPQLYRCGVSFAGVTDIGRLYSEWSDAGKMGREIGRFRDGDPDRDRARLDEVSPLLNAGRISAPLLIAHGDDDERVPIVHSRRLMRALDAAGRPYEWLLLPGQGHGFSDLRSAKVFMTRLLAFIDRHIGPPVPADPAR